MKEKSEDNRIIDSKIKIIKRQYILIEFSLVCVIQYTYEKDKEWSLSTKEIKLFIFLYSAIKYRKKCGEDMAIRMIFEGGKVLKGNFSNQIQICICWVILRTLR